MLNNTLKEDLNRNFKLSTLPNTSNIKSSTLPINGRLYEIILNPEVEWAQTCGPAPWPADATVRPRTRCTDAGARRAAV